MSDQLHVLDMPTIAPTGCDVRYAITFGEVAILHVGSQEYGLGRRTNGYSVLELHQIAENLNRIHSPDIAKVISVSSALPDHLKDSSTDAAVLVIRRGSHIIGGICADSLLAEQRGVDYDKQIDKSSKIRSSAGAAASWNSPLGPMTFILWLNFDPLKSFIKTYSARILP